MEGYDQAPPPAIDPVRIEVVEQDQRVQVLPYARLPASDGRCRYELVVRSGGPGGSSEARQSGDVPPQAEGPLGQTVVSVQPGGELSVDLSIYCGEPAVLQYRAERDLRF